MHCEWVPFDGTRFLKLDMVAAARTAAALLPLIPESIPGDQYGIDRLLRPLLQRALEGTLTAPIMDRHEILNERYFFERREGVLPPMFGAAFNKALSHFLVTTMSIPMEETEKKTINGSVYALMELEDAKQAPDTQES